MKIDLLGRGFVNEALKLLLLAAVLTCVLWFIPSYPESDLWGRFLNNFIYLLVFYLAVRWSSMMYAARRAK